MKATIEIPEGLLRKGESLELRPPLRGEIFLLPDRCWGRIQAVQDFETKRLVVIPSFNILQWMACNLPTPTTSCYLFLDDELSWWISGSWPIQSDGRLRPGADCTRVGFPFLPKAKPPAEYHRSIFRYTDFGWSIIGEWK